MITVASLQGLWRRSLIRRPGQPDDTTTRVCWLQGPEAYIDLRQPAGAPDFRNVHSLNDLTREHCQWLAHQEGFAGRLTYDGQHFEWLREIDFQPATAQADVGALHWDGNTLVELGRDVAYIEHWHRDSSTSPAHLTARDNTRLLVIDPYFMYARERASPLTDSRPLTEQVASAGTLQQAQRLIDCEISFGTVQNGSLMITASTLPFRVNQPCFP